MVCGLVTCCCGGKKLFTQLLDARLFIYDSWAMRAKGVDIGEGVELISPEDTARRRLDVKSQQHRSHRRGRSDGGGRNWEKKVLAARCMSLGLLPCHHDDIDKRTYICLTNIFYKPICDHIMIYKYIQHSCVHAYTRTHVRTAKWADNPLNLAQADFSARVMSPDNFKNNFFSPSIGRLGMSVVRGVKACPP